jgi:uncharacterized protein (DUF1800 family)
MAAYITTGDLTLRAGESTSIGRIASYITGTELIYSVNGVQGGNSNVGTVDANGVYTAPVIVPLANVVTVTTVAAKFPNGKPGSVKYTILNPIPVITSVSPSTFAEGTAAVTVNGSKFVYGARIFVNGAPVATTYVSGTQLVANIDAPLPGIYQLFISNPNPGAANSGVVNLTVTPGQVMLKLNAGEGTSVRVNNSIRFTLTITGTRNTGIIWQANGIPGGNAQIGTIVANSDGSATFTAPAVVPTPSNIVLLTAISVDNPAVSIIQNVAVLNPIPIIQSATPNSFSVGQATVTIGGDRFITGATVLMNGAPVPTTFNSGNQLTASLNLPEPGTIALQVLNPAPGPSTSQNLVATVSGNPPVPAVTPQDASRFLAQATFGATDGEIHHLSRIGYSDWFKEQFVAPQVAHMPYIEQQLILNNPPCPASDSKCNTDLFLNNDSQGYFLYSTFWQQAIDGDDQLRQRVVYALTEMMVVSATNGAVAKMPRGMANYYDVLGADAFGNFRKLIEDVTLSPIMGKFLSHLGNDKGDANRDPDENYAREVMQLFTIGLYQLNPDGTLKLDTTGKPIATYSNDDVMGMAKVLTGFSWGVPGNNSETAWGSCCIYGAPGYGEDLLPMQAYQNHHSTAEKKFLGVTIPASGNPDAQDDLKIALDTLFNHPNMGPFFSKQMIQHLVMSSPSPAYIGRVSAVFADNGYGVRGDMKSVITAILMDPEARDAASAASNPQYGKIREPLLRYTEWARAFTAQSRNGAYGIGTTEDPIYGLGQMSLRSPSVFNWFAPGYTPPGTSLDKAGLLAPEMQMTDVTTVVGYLNYMQNAITAGTVYGPDIFSTYSAEMALAGTPVELVDRINLLLMAGRMDANTRSQILAAVNSIAIPSTGADAINAALLNRVKTAIYLTMAAPSYSAQF